MFMDFPQTAPGRDGAAQVPKADEFESQSAAAVQNPPSRQEPGTAHLHLMNSDFGAQIPGMFSHTVVFVIQQMRYISSTTTAGEDREDLRSPPSDCWREFGLPLLSESLRLIVAVLFL
jgi:hypothetical protein